MIRKSKEKDNSSNLPRVLLFSHNCFSDSGSNGRTLSNLFAGWNRDKLAQFYIKKEKPNYNICSNYLNITDKEATYAFFRMYKEETLSKGEVDKNRKQKNVRLGLFSNKFSKTYLAQYLRNFFWNSRKWNFNELENWVDSFSPDVIVLQIGNYEFLMSIALEIASKRDIPIVIYNSEDYYFKKNKSYSPFYHFVNLKYKKVFEKLISFSSFTIYGNQVIEETYKSEFNHLSKTIYTSTSMQKSSRKTESDILNISYLGNLGVGRHIPLIEIAKILSELDSNLKLNVYGSVNNRAVINKILKTNEINYYGLIEYKEVMKVIYNSNLIIHAENFSDYYQKDLKHAFTTKTSDSLASGIPFLVYAPSSLAITKYLIKNNAACVVTNKENLKPLLYKMLYDNEFKNKYVLNALKTVNRDFNPVVTNQTFKSIILEVLDKEK